MKEKIIYTELSYVLGVIILAFGTSLMELANFGMSMVTAPPYILHLKISEYLPFFSFGMACYTFQAVLLVVLMLVVRKRKLSYLFSFFSAVIFGFTLDFMMMLMAPMAAEAIVPRVVYYVLGIIFCATGVSFLFHTYVTPEAYELFVKEVAATFKLDISKVKTIYDCSSLLVSVLFSFLFFGLFQFRGVHLGTLLCALVNGTIIGLISKFFDSHFTYKDALKFRTFFEKY